MGKAAAAAKAGSRQRQQVDFLIEDGRIWAVGEEGERRCICTVTVDVAAMEVEKERGRLWYVAALGRPLEREVRSPVRAAGEGLARAVVEAGAWADRKLLAAFLDRILAEKWAELIANPVIRSGGDDGGDPEECSAYEKFWEWVDNNLSMFDGEWGIIEERVNGRLVAVWTSAFARFFADIGIRSGAERRAVLEHWKEQGWLRPDAGRKFDATRWEGKSQRMRRAYVVWREKEENGSGGDPTKPHQTPPNAEPENR